MPIPNGRAGGTPRLQIVGRNSSGQVDGVGPAIAGARWPEHKGGREGRQEGRGDELTCPKAGRSGQGQRVLALEGTFNSWKWASTQRNGRDGHVLINK